MIKKSCTPLKKMLVVSSLTLSFLIVPVSIVRAEKTQDKWALIQDLIVASNMVEQITEEFGPFEHFAEDREQLEKDMGKEGYSDEQIQANMTVMNAFYQELQKAKAPILAKVVNEISEHLDSKFTHQEIQELLRFFTSPTMKKFRQVSMDKTPELMKMLQKAKADHLQEPFEKMKEDLKAIKEKAAKNAS